LRLSPRLEAWRVRSGHLASLPGNPYGVFKDVPGPAGRALLILAVNGDDTGWEHVSVSIPKQKHTPNWKEMCFVKDLFWDAEDAVVQFHPPRSAYVNNVSNCLHLWRPVDGVRLPPGILVGIKELGELG
jgi:hypothetical protein